MDITQLPLTTNERSDLHFILDDATIGDGARATTAEMLLRKLDTADATPVSNIVARVREALDEGRDSKLLTLALCQLTEQMIAGIRNVLACRDAMDDLIDDRAHDGENARAPEGDDYNDLYAVVGQLKHVLPN